MISETSHQTRRVERVPLFADEPKTLGDLLRRAASEKPRPNALNFKQNGAWQPITTAEILQRAENAALGLDFYGVTTGDRAAILAANCPAWTIADAACQIAGVIDVPIYTTLGAPQIEFILRDSGAKILFVENAALFETVKPLLINLPQLEKIIFFEQSENETTLADLEKTGAAARDKSPDLLEKWRESIKPHDTATLIYTSGTTGEPKGVMLSHANLLSNVIDTSDLFDFERDDVALSVLPLSHVFERAGMYLYFYHGMAVYFCEAIEKIPDNLREIRPTIFVGVPRIFEKVYSRAKIAAEKGGAVKTKIFNAAIEVAKEFARLKSANEKIPFILKIKYAVADKLVFSKLREVFGGRLKYCVSGGAALSDEVSLIFNGAGIPIMQGYGLTETSPVIATNGARNFRIGTVGKPLRETAVRIAADGEIEARGANIMQGYFNQPKATAEVFTSDGFFKTGDIGELDADGFLKITDRKKELFKTSGGKYLAPAPVENKIKASRYVNQVVLIGNERHFPAALIVPNFEQLENYAKAQNLELKTPAEFCASAAIIKLIEAEIENLTVDLGKFEKIKKIALLADELTIEGGELTPTLKIKRRVVDEKYKNVIDKIYTESETRTK